MVATLALQEEFQLVEGCLMSCDIHLWNSSLMYTLMESEGKSLEN